MNDLLFEITTMFVHGFDYRHLSWLVLLLFIFIIIIGIHYRKHQVKKTNDKDSLQTIGFIRNMVVSNNDEAKQYPVQFVVDAIDANGALLPINLNRNETKNHIQDIKSTNFISLRLDPLDLTKGMYDYSRKGSYIQDALDRLVVNQTNGELTIEKRRNFRKNTTSYPAKVMDIQEYNGSTIKIVHVHITVEYIDQYQSHVCTVSMVLPRYMLKCIHPKDECTLVVSKSDPSNALVDFKVACYDPNQ